MTAGPPAAARLPRLLAVESLRVGSHRTVRLAVLGAVLLVATMAVLYAFFSREIPPPQGADSALADPAVLRKVYLSGFTFGFILAAMLGCWVAVGGRGEGDLLFGLLTSPRRWQLAAAKAAAALLAGLALGTMTILTSVSIGMLFAAAGGQPSRLADPQIRDALQHAWLAIPLWSLLGCGTGLLLGRFTAAISALLLWVFLLDVVLSGLLQAAGLSAAAGMLPTNLTAAISGDAVAAPISRLGPGEATAVLAGYALALTGLGAGRFVVAADDGADG